MLGVEGWRRRSGGVCAAGRSETGEMMTVNGSHRENRLPQRVFQVFWGNLTKQGSHLFLLVSLLHFGFFSALDRAPTCAHGFTSSGGPCACAPPHRHLSSHIRTDTGTRGRSSTALPKLGSWAAVSHAKSERSPWTAFISFDVSAAMLASSAPKAMSCVATVIRSSAA